MSLPGVIIVALLGILIGAVFLRLAVKVVTGERIPFGKSFFTSGILYLFNLVVTPVLKTAMPSMEITSSTLLWITGITFFIQVGIIAGILKITYGKALMVAFVMIGIGLILLIVLKMIFSF